MASALIHVGIVDDHPVVAEGTAALLRAEADIDVVGVAPSLEAARAVGLFDAQRVDVLLLDIRLGSESGLAALTADSTVSASPRPEIIVLTAYD